ncbi:MAG: potassium-transporting ATPase subunit KdpC [Gemmatimonadetes bacterium]|nr:potassium-transporting ATPase subunit KdpC [Gemmatimonadota bacterium]MBK7922712.1 potassium-transporting ATPase subunit KdpC [Gemmatimonadota bacterium]MBK9691760.1 potassium-transporting ATPase subunit KdpC [Gemmatimonadota bacterium]
MRTLLRPAVVSLLLLTLLTGVLYPVAVTGIGAALFPHQAAGSQLRAGDRVVGSALIGQPFSGPQYFWSRPSATGPVPYNGALSSGSNLGPSNPALHQAVADRIAALRAADPDNLAPVPVDLVTASASGLDPHITPAAAEFQAARVARSRGLPVDSVRALVARYTEGRQFGILGEPRVHVLRLNLALDGVTAAP